MTERCRGDAPTRRGGRGDRPRHPATCATTSSASVPASSSDRHLGQALQQLGQEFEGKTDIVTAVDVDGDVAAALASMAADVVQLSHEALSNVGRHAGATTCRISLKRRDAHAVLEIDDDGSGFDPSERAAGMGLTNLTDRVHGLGGELTIESAQGSGTIVRARLPL